MKSLGTRSILFAIGLAGACAPGRLPDSGPRPHSTSPLTARELAVFSPATTLLEAVAQLRPVYLGPRCRGKGDRPTVVVVDGFIAGDVRVLGELRVVAVRSVELLCYTDAMQRLGSRVNGAVILVTTGTPPRV